MLLGDRILRQAELARQINDQAVIKLCRQLAAGVDAETAWSVAGMPSSDDWQTQFAEIERRQDVREYVALAAMDPATQETVSKERTLLELAKIAYSDLSEVMVVNLETGNVDINWALLQGKYGPAVASIEINNRKLKDETVDQKIKITLWSKLKALDLLAKALSLYAKESTEDDFVREFLAAAKRRQEEAIREADDYKRRQQAA